jgi:hypothetical protein
MSYQGMMDGWHGDENECLGHCGLCDDCDDKYHQRCDEEYESWRDEQLFN